MRNNKNLKLYIGIILCYILIIGGTQYYWTVKNSPKVIEIIVKDKKLVSPTSPFKVHLKDKIEFRVTSDSADYFHLEGYHAFGRLVPGETASIPVQALSAGTFPIFLDKNHFLLGYLEVLE